MTNINILFDQLSKALAYGKISSYGIAYNDDFLKISVDDQLDNATRKALLNWHTQLLFKFTEPVIDRSKRPRRKILQWRQLAINI